MNDALVAHLIALLCIPDEAVRFVESQLDHFDSDSAPGNDTEILVCVTGFMAGPRLEHRCGDLLHEYLRAAPSLRERLRRLVEVLQAMKTLGVSPGNSQRDKLLARLCSMIDEAAQREWGEDSNLYALFLMLRALRRHHPDGYVVILTPRALRS